MYIAEVRGKFTPSEERKEDILTSNVFSFFKYAKREVFLYQLLQLIKTPVQKKDVEGAEFIFWPTYEDGTEPDLVLIVGEYYLLFEAKLHSGFSKGINISQHQICREISGGEIEARNLNKRFKFIAVTAHYEKARFLAENPIVSAFNFQWINWHQIALLLQRILHNYNSLDKETRCFAEDLYSLFLNKNLRSFAGVEVLTSLKNLHHSSPVLFFDPKTAEHRGDFLGFISSLEESLLLLPSPESIFFRAEFPFSYNVIDELQNYIPEAIFFEVRNGQN